MPFACMKDTQDRAKSIGRDDRAGANRAQARNPPLVLGAAF